MRNVSNPSYGKITNQTDVTATRALGVTYQNLTGKPLYVSVSVGSGALTDNSIVYRSDAVTPPNTSLSLYRQLAGATNQNGASTFIVLPGNYYQAVVLSGSFTLLAWIEWY